MNDDSSRKHSGLAMPTPTLISRHVPARVFMAATATDYWGLEGRREGRRHFPSNEKYSAVFLLRRKILFSPFAFSKNVERASGAVRHRYPSFSLDTATNERGEVTSEEGGAGNLSQLAGNHSGSSVLSVSRRTVARFLLIKHSIECS